MIDKKRVIKGLEEISDYFFDIYRNDTDSYKCAKAQEYSDCAIDAIALLKEQGKEIKALRLLVEWATNCDFGFDQFPDEYERYKGEIKDMEYIDGMIHIAKRTLEDHGAFEER